MLGSELMASLHAVGFPDTGEHYLVMRRGGAGGWGCCTCVSGGWWGWTSLVAQIVKASAYNAGDPGSIPG